MMYVPREQRALNQRIENFWQRQIGNVDELISDSGVSCDLDPETAKLLNQSPDVGTRGSDLFGQFGATDDQRGIVGEHADDMAESLVVGQIRVGRSSRFAIAASCERSRDELIIRLRKNETQMESPDAVLACSYRVSSSRRAAFKIVQTPECKRVFKPTQFRIPSVKGTNMWTAVSCA